MTEPDEIVITEIDGVPLSEIDVLRVTGLEPVDPDATGRTSKLRVIAPKVEISFWSPTSPGTLKVYTQR